MPNITSTVLALTGLALLVFLSVTDFVTAAQACHRWWHECRSAPFPVAALGLPALIGLGAYAVARARKKKK